MTEPRRPVTAADPPTTAEAGSSAVVAGPGTDLGGLRAVLAIPLARRFLVIPLTFGLGAWMFEVALLWAVLAGSGSTTAAGVAYGLLVVPVALATVPAGVLTDRFGPRPVLVAALLATLLLIVGATAAVLLVGRLSTPALLVLTGLYGLVVGFIEVPANVYLGRTIDRRLMPSAFGASWLVSSAARAVASLVAGALVTIAGFAAALAVSAALFAAGVAAAQRLAPVDPDAAIGGAAVGGQLREAIAWTRRQPVALAAIGLGIATSMFGFTYFGYLPAVSRDLLAGGPAELGLLTGAGGAGGIVAGGLLGRIAARLGLGRAILAGSIGGGLAAIVLGLSNVLALSLVAAGLLPGFLLVWHALTIVLFQALAPVHLRGRALSTFVLVFVLAAPIGSIGGGILADAFGVTATLVGSGVVLIAWSLGVGVASPALRRLATTSDADPSPAARHPHLEAGIP